MRPKTPILPWKPIAYGVVLLCLIAMRLADQCGIPNFGMEQLLERLRDSFDQEHKFELVARVIDVAISWWRNLKR